MESKISKGNYNDLLVDILRHHLYTINFVKFTQFYNSANIQDKDMKIDSQIPS